MKILVNKKVLETVLCLVTDSLKNNCCWETNMVHIDMMLRDILYNDSVLVSETLDIKTKLDYSNEWNDPDRPDHIELRQYKEIISEILDMLAEYGNDCPGLDSGHPILPRRDYTIRNKAAKLRRKLDKVDENTSR